MIHGIGIDLIEIERFGQWQNYSEKSLRRIFSEKEIAYCKKVPALCSARFAAHFALKEAAFKASNSLFFPHQITFLQFCKAIAIESFENMPPCISLDWQQLKLESKSVVINASLTHNQTAAAAVVVIFEG